MRPWIKVCGITRSEDAQSAVKAGVHAVGFILVEESPRRVSPARAAALARGLPARVARVGVVANARGPAVRDLVEEIGLSAVQAHGEESAETCRSYGVPVVKVFRTGGGFHMDDLEPYREFPVLFDGFSPERRGGTGITAEWSVAREAVDRGYRVLLAGGLDPGNVVDAVRTVHPVAVDLNSGVEIEPGIKDGRRIEAAVQAVHAAARGEEAPWPW